MPASPSPREQAARHVAVGDRALGGGDAASARVSYEAAVALEPSWAEPRYRLARAVFALGDRDGAERLARTAVAADPRHAAANHLVGTLHCDRDAYADAMPWLRAAAALAPEASEYLRDFGVVQLFAGDIAGGRASLSRALEIDPLTPDILPTLVRMTPMGSGEADAERLFSLTQSLAQQIDHLPPPAQVRLLFALGKALEDRGDADAAFDAYTRANALHRATILYDVAEDEARLEAVARIFDPALFERFATRATAVTSERPIFIVGMPRSGTTLVEQIISAHPDVYGAGEIDDFRRLVRTGRGAGGTLFPEWAATMNEADLNAFATAFLAALPAGLPGQTRLTAKRLENFEFLGLIHLCLPNATLIHCRRDPRDSCLSAFAMLFVDEQAFSYELTELGRYWRAYDRLMAHWAKVLPAGRVLEVSYEALVADQEGWTRRLLDHCGLAFDEACLRFYESPRLVRSASFTQVREPIFTTSLGRWRPFAHRLQPLFDGMGEPWASRGAGI
jgi:Tfp pilus assembly protein PilF